MRALRACVEPEICCRRVVPVDRIAQPTVGLFVVNVVGHDIHGALNLRHIAHASLLNNVRLMEAVPGAGEPRMEHRREGEPCHVTGESTALSSLVPS